MKGDAHGLEITGEGLKAIEELFRKFLIYMEKSNTDELRTWINTLKLHKHSSQKLIRNSYHYIINEPLVREAFFSYLNELGTLENVWIFQVEVKQQEPNLAELIEDLFQDISDINKLFKHKFGKNLFFISPEVYSIMSKATRGKNVDYSKFVGSVALVLDAIYHKELLNLVEPGKELPGPVNKFEGILKHNNVRYNPDTISKLRFIRQIRNTTPPTHVAGSQEVDDLKKVGLTFPIKDHREAAITILKSLISCLKEMKTWFVVK